MSDMAWWMGALAALSGCGAPAPRRDEAPRHAPAPASQAPAMEQGVEHGAEPSADPMWPFVAARQAFFREKGGCRSLALRPVGVPGAYTGEAIFEHEGVTIAFRYERAPPRLSAPRLQAGGRTIALPCDEEARMGWFVARDDCADAKAPPGIEAVGCVRALEAAQRERLRRALDGSHDAALVEALAKHDAMWEADCARPWRRKMGRRAVGESMWKRQLAGAPDSLPILYPSGGYPVMAVDAEPGGVELYELSIANPYEKKQAGGSIAIGCCGKRHYSVLDVTGEGAVLVGPQGDVWRWYWSAEACRAAQAAP